MGTYEIFNMAWLEPSAVDARIEADYLTVTGEVVTFYKMQQRAGFMAAATTIAVLHLNEGMYVKEITSPDEA